MLSRIGWPALPQRNRGGSALLRLDADDVPLEGLRQYFVSHPTLRSTTLDEAKPPNFPRASVMESTVMFCQGFAVTVKNTTVPSGDPFGSFAAEPPGIGAPTGFDDGAHALYTVAACFHFADGQIS